MRRPAHLYGGINDLRRHDNAYRTVYRDEEKFRLKMQTTYRDFYKKGYEGLAEGAQARATFADFLGQLSTRLLPASPESLAHKLNWTSFEYYFASAAKHLETDLLGYEYKFYCASALMAVHELIRHCDNTVPPRVPYVFIVTTQSPEEYLADPEPNERKDSYSYARKMYREAFAYEIGRRKNKSLIVERHTLVTDNDDTNNGRNIPYLSPRPDSLPDTEREKFLQWLKENHHWHVRDEALEAASTAYVNVVRHDDLPKKDSPSDDDMCIDLIVFGVASAAGQLLTTNWKFGIGVFGAVRPENLQGRFVKLFSEHDLMDDDRRFPLLGYTVPNFEHLVRMLHGEVPEDPRHMNLKQSTRFVDTSPWSELVDDKTKSEAKKKSQYEEHVYEPLDVGTYPTPNRLQEQRASAPVPRSAIEYLSAEESDILEVKASLGLDIGGLMKSDRPATREDLNSPIGNALIKEVLTTLVAFLNSNGGELVIGAAEEKKFSGPALEKLKQFPAIGNGYRAVGIEEEFKLYSSEPSWDGFVGRLTQHIINRIGSDYGSSISCHRVPAAEDRTLCVVQVRPLPGGDPAFLDREHYYVRVNNSTRLLKGPDLTSHVERRRISVLRNSPT
jgi:hypothetical protein